MAYSAFDDASREPSDSELAAVLHGAALLWTALRTEIASRHEPVVEEWTFSGKKWGWAMRLNHKNRVILYLTPSEAAFFVGFALGEKAVTAARISDLPPALIEQIDDSQEYAEGRAGRLEVKTPEDVDHVVKIAAIKIAN